MGVSTATVVSAQSILKLSPDFMQDKAKQ